MQTQNQSGNSQGDESANNKTKNTKQRSPFAYSRIVFVEYAYAAPGQHHISVMNRVGKKKLVIARIFREWDQEAKKYKYTTKDREGNEIYEPTYDLFKLKKQFISNEKNLEAGKEKTEVAKEAEQSSASRAEELSEVRKGKDVKSNEIER